MSVRRLIVEVDLGRLNVTEFCRKHGISTWFFSQLRKRYAAEGGAAIEPRSRAPKTVPNRISEWVEDVIVDHAQEAGRQRLDAGRCHDLVSPGHVHNGACYINKRYSITIGANHTTTKPQRSSPASPVTSSSPAASSDTSNSTPPADINPYTIDPEDYEGCPRQP